MKAVFISQSQSLDLLEGTTSAIAAKSLKSNLAGLYLRLALLTTRPVCLLLTQKHSLTYN